MANLTHQCIDIWQLSVASFEKNDDALLSLLSTDERIKAVIFISKRIDEALLCYVLF